jgi:adenylate cyclase class IV
MTLLRRNLELKARNHDPEQSLQVCEELGAADQGVLRQKDTYFRVHRGWLKLRQERDGPAQLIAYERGNAPSARESHYRIAEVGDPAAMEQTLGAALGVIATVAKTRHLFLFKGVRIHLDAVEGLGNFIEFEGVATPGVATVDRFEQLLRDLCGSFEIGDGDLVGESYCDLVLDAAPASGHLDIDRASK